MRTGCCEDHLETQAAAACSDPERAGRRKGAYVHVLILHPVKCKGRKTGFNF
jgi:hypothetical protein